MDKPDISKTKFVRDEMSRVLALSDALASADGPGLSDAFLEVARAKGMAQVAADAGLSIDAVYSALADRTNPDVAVLTHIVDSMRRRATPPPRSNDR